MSKYDTIERIGKEMDDTLETSTRDMIHAYYDIMSYNIDIDPLGDLIKYILSHIEDDQIGFDDIRDIVDKDPDHPIRIFYSILVDLYGDYGTSPRFGWLYPNQHKDLKLICEFIIALIEWEKEGN